jgi:hypothetical protein
MKMRYSLVLAVVILPLFSCAARIDGSVSADGSAVFSVEMNLGPRMTALIRSLNSAAGQDDALILDGPGMARSMSMEGMTSVSLKNTGPGAVEGEFRVLNINQFLAAGGKGGFITFTQVSNGGSCKININLENGPGILENLSPDIADYMNALMAPIATGEAMSKSEYLDLVTTFYNRNISNEIAASMINVSINFPGNISSVTGGTFSGRRAVFDISLLDFLVLETPLVREVNWR